MKEFFAMVISEFGDRLHDRDFMVERFKRHTEEVLARTPKERLLVFEASQGWEPLCAFLGVPVPDKPYPRENSREEFQARAGQGGGTDEDRAAHIKAMLDETRNR
jgi:hypothetical protein